jgi:hypothetical protein
MAAPWPRRTDNKRATWTGLLADIDRGWDPVRLLLMQTATFMAVISQRHRLIDVASLPAPDG